MNALTVRDLTVTYGGAAALWDVDADVPAGSLCAIVGPNGAGKSTLLRSCLELIPKSAGTVQFFGDSLSSARKRIAYVPQRNAVDWDFPIDALGVALMGVYPRLGWFRRPNREDRDWAMACLARVGMVEFAGRSIGELSGGQQQRVFLARALAQKADLFLLDEPFAGVDAVTEESLIRIMKALQAEGATLVAVHHDLHTVEDIFDHAILLNVQVYGCGPTSESLQEPNLKACYRGRTGAS